MTQVYLALHVGDVLYGNVGSKDRLDFTVIGPAVNEVSRILAMSRSVEQDVRDALAGIGAEVNETPITPRRVLTAIKAARAAASSKLWHQDRSR